MADEFCTHTHTHTHQLANGRFIQNAFFFVPLRCFSVDRLTFRHVKVQLLINVFQLHCAVPCFQTQHVPCERTVLHRAIERALSCANDLSVTSSMQCMCKYLCSSLDPLSLCIQQEQGIRFQMSSHLTGNGAHNSVTLWQQQFQMLKG